MPISQVALPISLGSRGWAMVTQGFGGTVSHNGILYHSLDFTYGSNSVFGASVVAHASGVVVALRESLRDGGSASTSSSDPSNGPSNLGNFVTVYYASSGLYVTYAHLQYNGVVPALGQTVSAGSTLGYVGNTGLRTATHLHVTYGLDDTVWTAGTIANGSSSLGTPVSFDTANGQIGPGIVAQVTFDLASQTLAADRHHLYLMGSSSINGFGDSFANLISGNRGNNVLDGRTGNDTLLGGSGNDTLIGGAGNDTLNGGSGTDTASYLSSSSAVTVSLASSGQQNTGSSTGDDTLISIENLIGSSYGDRLTGNTAANLIDAGSGNDRADAGSGDDTVYGGSGNDTLIGGSGRDTLYGGNDSDILTGGADQDSLFGGSGADYFDFNLTSESRPGSSTRDVIRDFQYGDRIDLRDIDASTLLSGDQAFRFIGSQSFHRVAGELSFSGGIVRGDTNGDGVADFEIQVFGVSSLSTSDFLL